MIYSYDKKRLQFKKIKLVKPSLVLFAAMVSLTITSYLVGRYQNIKSLSQFEKNVVLVNMNSEPFHEEELVVLMKELKIKFPHIVMAQSILETGDFKSHIFKENHNLFGMKQAMSRVNTAKGTKNNHAYYDTWEESVYDYAFYQCRFLGGIGSEEDYFKYLGNSYAEAGNYVVMLKKVIEDRKLKEKFQ
jgi:hypothetical protein